MQTPFIKWLKVGPGVGMEAMLGNSGWRSRDLRGEVRNQNLLEMPRLPSGRGAWASGHSARVLAPLSLRRSNPGESPRCLPGLGFQELEWPVLQSRSQGVCSPRFAASPYLPPGSSQAKVTSGEPRWKWLWGARERDRLEEVNNSHTGQSRSERQPQLTVVKHLLCQTLS